ncbi:PD40 domain-containing protein [Polyangium aurulentum]|uniref:PD40 domain-containing protein n=1 Tax=Polyangium aurulentum TaxID=2567896 RepID=UPI0010AE2E5C|nr:PD40 domain-containing protein [Polyangium aurulentum]UQA59480.1 PD40 domain-containing protein [Polyangium aurulentum]
MALAAGCGVKGNSGGGFGGEGGGTTSGNNSGGNGGTGGCFLNCGPGSGSGGQNQGLLAISPANPTLMVIDGNVPTQGFTVTMNGQDVTNNVTWVYERPDIGDMTGTTFQPTGKVGGVGTLTAKMQNADGTTTVTVNVKKTNNSAGFDPGTIGQFDNPVGADPGMNVVYPFHDTVFPLGVLSPEVQWNGVSAGDKYRLKITEKHMEYVTYFTANTPARHTISQADWVDIGASGTGAQSDPVTVQLQRISNGQAYQPVTQTWHIAQGRLKGSVYYWELPGVCGGFNSNGRILRIKPDAEAVDEFFNPGKCWGCHTVSRDGTTMMATYDGATPFPQITVDLTKNPAQPGTITPANGLGGTFSAFNDTGSRIILSNDAATNPSGSRLRIVDSANGTVLNDNAMGSGCGEPAWSPDGTKLAAICGLSGGGWVFDATGGHLAVADVGPDGTSVTNVQQIVAQAGSPGRPAYPSFAPGSEYIAFGRPTQGSRSTGNGDLWMVKKDGSELKKLAIASNDNRSFNPVFAPLRAGGYFWLVFISRRDYGNTLVSTNRQQLWVTAIDDPPTAGDPSHPPFYMRGQEGCGLSENAYYALDPCKKQGEGCTTGADCCGGQCVKDGAGVYTCGEPPPPGSCSESGNACTTKADCCDPVDECIDGFCQQKPPK